MRRLIALAFALLAVPAWAQGHLAPYASLAEMSIPAPGWAWDTTVLAEYGDADFVTHYFDNTGTCTDTANAQGSIANPRCTPPVMTGLAAGSVVQGCGTYARGTSDITVTASGTAADPVFFQERGVANCAGGLIFTFSGTGNMVFSSSTYLIVKGMSWTAVEGAVCNTCSNYSLLDNDISGTSATADSGAMLSVVSSTDVVRARNIVHDGGDWLNAAENDTHCLSVGSGITNLWDLYNTVYQCSGDGNGNGHDANQTTSALYIGGNEFYSHRENCIDLKEVNKVIISRNYCHDIASSSSSPGEGIVIHYGPTAGGGPYNVWILNNVIETVVIGVAYSDVEAPAGELHVVVGNEIRNCSVGINHNNTSSAGVTFHFKHNTIANCATGIWIGSALGAANVGGNIIREASTRHFGADTTGIRDVTEAFNELYYDTDGGIQIGWASTGTTYTSIAAAIAGTADWDNSLQADPLMTNFGSNDFTLTSSSPAINVGLDMSALETTFGGLFTTSLLYDADGNARPNGVWDMGAYEWVADAGTPTAKPVYRLRVREDE